MLKAASPLSNLTELEQQVLAEISQEKCVQLIKELVPIGQPLCGNSIDPEAPMAHEGDISKHVGRHLQELGLDVEWVAAIEGRPNVVARWNDGLEGPTLIFNDHLDTYPSCDPKEWHMTGHNPYNATLHDKYLYGRGTSDTRGNMTCQLMAIAALHKAGVKLQGQLVCAYTVDEERHGKAGALHLLNEWGLTGDYEITAEPTAWTKDEEWGIGIALAHSGLCLLDLETTGVRSHIWRPDEGVNPILHMTRLIEALHQTSFTHEAPQIYGPTPPSICPVRFEAGKIGEGQFTPPTCRARVWVIGLVPGMTYESIVQDIRKVIDQLQAEDPTFQAAIVPVAGETFVPASIEVSKDAAHVQAISKAYERVLGKQPVLYRKNAYCDTLRFSHSGIPSITFGPGEDGWPPVNEYIDMEKVVTATQIYALFLLDFFQAQKGS
jgi:acetylornithine deacetylase/succinyl-diaminopimelate desuccinylase-like protein